QPYHPSNILSLLFSIICCMCHCIFQWNHARNNGKKCIHTMLINDAAIIPESSSDADDRDIILLCCFRYSDWCFPINRLPVDFSFPCYNERGIRHLLFQLYRFGNNVHTSFQIGSQKGKQTCSEPTCST